jgi:hypothetical protein
MDGNGHSQMKLCRKGIKHHGYTLNTTSRKIEEFKKVIKDSFRIGAIFMNSLLLVWFNGKA